MLGHEALTRHFTIKRLDLNQLDQLFATIKLTTRSFIKIWIISF